MRKTIPVLLMLIVSVGVCEAQDSSALNSLVAAERAFARTSLERGTREAFLSFFAEDGVNFTPHPVHTRQNLLSRPAPIPATVTVLNWAPVTGDVSRAGDLGYTTGPYTATEQSTGRTLRHGVYFSVWRREAEGSWRVVVDCGTRNEKPVAKLTDRFQAFSPEAATPMSCGDEGMEARCALLEAEQGFLKEADAAGIRRAYENYIHQDARLQRNGVEPRSGIRAILGYLSRQSGVLSGELLRFEISQSCDLAYAYGSYELQQSGGSVEKGYYVRVWKRDSRNRWRITVDIASPIPPPAS